MLRKIDAPKRVWVTISRDGLPVAMYESREAAKHAADAREDGWRVRSYTLEIG